MASKEYHFAVISKITLEHEKGAQTSILKRSDLRLEVSGNLDKGQYLDGKSLPRKDALKPITNALVHGLIVHVSNCANKGWMKEGDHMKYIFSELQRAFVALKSDPHESTMEY